MVGTGALAGAGFAEVALAVAVFAVANAGVVGRTRPAMIVEAMRAALRREIFTLGWPFVESQGGPALSYRRPTFGNSRIPIASVVPLGSTTVTPRTSHGTIDENSL
jgi:hypothetical protein